MSNSRHNLIWRISSMASPPFVAWKPIISLDDIMELMVGAALENFEINKFH
jgi:hypothetical protein